MIPLLSLLMMASASADTALLEETTGVIGRQVAAVPGGQEALAYSERGEWEAAMVAWHALAEETGALEARLWEMVAAYRAGQADAAREAAVLAMSQAPGDQTALLAATWLLNEDGHHARAAKLLRRFPDTSHDAHGAIILQMRALMMDGRTRRALRVRERALSAGSDDAWFWFELALEDAWRGRPEAEQHMRRSLRAAGVAPMHYQLLLHHLTEQGDVSGAVKAGVEGMERFPDDSGIGIAVLEICQEGAGRSALQTLVAHDPDRAVAQALLGTLLLVDEEPGVAAQHFAAAIAGGEDRPSVYRLLSEAFVAAEQRGLAWGALTGGLEAHPDNPRLWADLFSLGRDQDRLSEALQLSETAWQGGAQSSFLVQYSYRAASDIDELEAALRWSERGLRITDLAAESMSWRALALSRLGRGSEALVAYEDALERSPGNPTLLNNLAWFLLQPGEGVSPDPARARELARAALDGVEVPVPAYLDTLAAAHWQLGDHTEAVDLQRRAARLDPGDPDIQRTLERYEGQAP